MGIRWRGRPAPARIGRLFDDGATRGALPACTPNCMPMSPNALYARRQAGFPIDIFKAEGYSIEQLREGGFDLKEIAEAGFRVGSFCRTNLNSSSSSTASLGAAPVTYRRGLPPRRPGDFLAAQEAKGQTKQGGREAAVKAQTAASDVQRIYRGHLTREGKKATEREAAAADVQRLYRGHRVREGKKTTEREAAAQAHAAAADVQRLYRGHRAREEKKAAKEQEEAAKVRLHSASLDPECIALQSPQPHDEALVSPNPNLGPGP